MTGAAPTKSGAFDFHPATWSTKIGLEAFEYTFPASQGAANATHFSGQKSESPVGSFGPMQPAGSKVQVKCSWDFSH